MVGPSRPGSDIKHHDYDVKQAAAGSERQARSRLRLAGARYFSDINASSACHCKLPGLPAVSRVHSLRPSRAKDPGAGPPHQRPWPTTTRGPRLRGRCAASTRRGTGISGRPPAPPRTPRRLTARDAAARAKGVTAEKQEEAKTRSFCRELSGGGCLDTALAQVDR